MKVLHGKTYTHTHLSRNAILETMANYVADSLCSMGYPEQRSMAKRCSIRKTWDDGMRKQFIAFLDVDTKNCRVLGIFDWTRLAPSLYHLNAHVVQHNFDKHN